MKHFMLAICSATTMVLAACAVPAQAQWANAQLYGGRPPPPTEPSVVIATPAAAAKVEPTKPVVRQIIVRRPHSIQSGPVTMPSPEVLVMMVRAALTALNQANFTENYSVLRGMTTPALQTRASPAQLGKAFADIRKQNLDLSPALVLAPQFTEPPALTPGGALKVTGIFPSRPLRINFAIDYLPIDGFWMIDQMSVSASRADAPLAVAAAAPVAAPAPEQKAAAAPVAASAPRPVVAGIGAAMAAPAPQVAPARLPAPAPVPAAEPAKPEWSEAALGFMPGSLPTRQFVPVKYRVEYQPAFIPRAQQPKPKAPAAATAKANAKTKSGAAHDRQGPAVYVQLTSQRSETEAKAAFNSMRAKYPEILGDRPAVIRRADLGSKGVYYRAQIGPVSAEQAGLQCSQLKAVGGQCFVQYN